MPICDNVTGANFNLSRRVVVASVDPPRTPYSAMPHSPSSSMQREALVNCTNVTSEPIHNISKPSTPPWHGLFKRSCSAEDGGARLKRLKFSSGESRPCEEDERGNDVDSEESEEDTGTTFCTAHRNRTMFHARRALAMSRPGVTCRPLSCKHTSTIA